MAFDMHHFKKTLKKIWHFIWESDSVWSWIVNIILAFILIKFIVYPGLGFALQTSHPVVAVVSGSMEHKMVEKGSIYEICGKGFDEKQRMTFERYWETCGPWYSDHTDITKEEFKEFMFSNGFNTGDIMVLKGVDPEDVNVGDTIVYVSPSEPHPIIHRVVGISDDGKYRLVMKGDHNGGADRGGDYISSDRIIGKAVFRIPFLGWIKKGAANAWTSITYNWHAMRGA